MEAVQATTAAFVETLTDASAQHTVSAFGQQKRVMDLLATVITHGSSHAGEIATLRTLYKLRPDSA